MGHPTPVLAALGGYLFTYYNTRITEERKARIERVNDQVDCLNSLLCTACDALPFCCFGVRKGVQHLHLQLPQL